VRPDGENVRERRWPAGHWRAFSIPILNNTGRFLCWSAQPKLDDTGIREPGARLDRLHKCPRIRPFPPAGIRRQASERRARRQAALFRYYEACREIDRELREIDRELRNAFEATRPTNSNQDSRDLAGWRDWTKLSVPG
jgi:hypothetical protein